MFHQIPGGKKAKLRSMNDALYRFYKTFLTRVIRNPHSAFHQDQRPLFFAAPDYPVPKHDKEWLSDIAINDGLHMHGILVVPLQSRLKKDLIGHIQQYRRLYLPPPLRRIHIRGIEGNFGRVSDYICKSIKKGRNTWDDVIILPKNRSEIRPTSELFKEMVKWVEVGLMPRYVPNTSKCSSSKPFDFEETLASASVFRRQFEPPSLKD